MITEAVSQFLKKYFADSRPLLLALSGGPDSRALFEALCELGTPFAAAHVDHGWRLESGAEAKELQELAKVRSIPFYLETLPKMINEEACRNARLEFFKRVCSENGYAAVLLGHHQDDQVETVLKRFFEGANLHKLHAIKPIHKINGLTLCRPLLTVGKNEILDWLDRRQVVPFFDSTNSDSQFLRGRMRNELIPYLEQVFGKGIKSPLCKIASDAHELDAWGQTLFEGVEKQEGPFGIYYNLNGFRDFPLKLLISKIADYHRISLNRLELSQTEQLIASGSANKHVGDKLYIDRGYLMLLNDFEPLFGEPVLLKAGRFEWGSFIVEVQDVKSSVSTFPDWRDFWLGRMSVNLPLDGLILSPPNDLKPWDKLRTDGKVPACLRKMSPLVKKGETDVYDFLSGCSRVNGGEGVEMTLKLLLS